MKKNLIFLLQGFFLFNDVRKSDNGLVMRSMYHFIECCGFLLHLYEFASCFEKFALESTHVTRSSVGLDHVYKMLNVCKMLNFRIEICQFFGV